MDVLIDELSERWEKSPIGIKARADLFVTRKGGLSQSTWIHPELVVKFGRWLDPKFTILYNQTIKQILKGTHSVITAPQTLPEVLAPVVVKEVTILMMLSKG